MPVTTPAIKVETVRRLGGRAVLQGDSYDEAFDYATRLARERVDVHSSVRRSGCDRGQGTVGMEMLRQHADPIHGLRAGRWRRLIAGVAAYIKDIRPEIKVIGVEPEDAPTMERALAAGRRITLPRVGLFADGVAVRQIGEEPFRIARKTVDEMILVSTDEICAAIKDVFDDTAVWQSRQVRWRSRASEAWRAKEQPTIH